jgi:hypothetical protein
VALPVNEQLFLECLNCDARLRVRPEQEDSIRGRLLTRERIAGLASGSMMMPQREGSGGSAGRTAYQVLQVDPAADVEVIQAAFKRLALKYHPDRSSDPLAPDRMRELIAAHDMLTDENRRHRYDQSLGIVRKRPEPPRPPAMRAEDV